MKIGNRIKKIREYKNYTQEWMAGQLGITQRAYSKIENDEVTLSVDKLFSISEILDVNVSEFLNNDGKYIYNNITTHQKGGTAFVINQAEKAMELYEKLLAEKDAHIATLQKLVNKK